MASWRGPLSKHQENFTSRGNIHEHIISVAQTHTEQTDVTKYVRQLLCVTSQTDMLLEKTKQWIKSMSFILYDDLNGQHYTVKNDRRMQ
jgi:4-hydroxy-3-methylbut-2-enyl diphosphate reductase IspH